MPVIKLRGLPWSCTPEDIEQFLGESINIVKTKSEDDEQQQSSDNDSSNNNTHHSLSICLTTNAEGRPSGEAFVELVDESDVETALRKNNGMMGQRYIEVFRSSIEQMKRFTAESNESASQWRDPVVRIRGLPYGCTKKDVHEFFNGLSIAYDGILLVVDFSGRFNGEAFVHFSNMSDAHKALEKHKQKMGNRYLEIFRSSLKEKRHYSGDGGGGEQDNYGGDFFGGETMMGGGMMGFGDDYSNNGFSNGGGGGGGRNGKMMNKRGMKGSGRFNGSNGNIGGGMGGGGMDNRSRPYPNMRGGGNRQNGGGGGNFGGQSGNMMGPGGFGNGNNGNSGVGGLPSLMGNSFNANGAGGFGGGVGPLMMGGPNNPSSFFNGGNDFNMRFGGNKNSQQQNIDSSYESGFGLKMRGLPFSCREDDIYEFFAPLKPVRVEFLRGRDSRPSGECEVDFESQDELDEAMTYDKKFIGNRYIELFLLNNNNGNNGNTNSLGGVGVGGGGGGGGGGGKNMGNKNSANGGGGGGSNGLMSQHHHHSNNNHNNGNMNFGGSGGNKSGGRGGGGQSNGNNGTSATANIPSLFAQPTIPAPIAAGLGGGGGGMTTAYPHQQMAAAVSAYSANSMGDMLMADMAKKMFQNAFAPYQNQMFHHNHQQIEPPQQFHQHFGSGGGGGGGGGGGNKGHNRRF